MDLDFRAARNARDEFGSRTSRHGLLPIGHSSAKPGQSWPRPNNEKLTHLTQVFSLPGKLNAP
jgi:hypothetical protein